MARAADSEGWEGWAVQALSPLLIREARVARVRVAPVGQSIHRTLAGRRTF